jgi:hypothetical protein
MSNNKREYTLTSLNAALIVGDVSLDNDLSTSGDELSIPSGNTLTIASGVTLTNGGTIDNNGTINNGGTIYNDRIIYSDGLIYNYGTIDNHGYFVNSGTIYLNGGTIISPDGWSGGLPVLPAIFKGDINLDDVINETDLNYILKHWGESNVQHTSSRSGLISRLMDNIKDRDIIIKDRDIIIKDRDIIIKQLRNN